MKKYIYIAFAAAAFASCSQDETLVLNQEEIQFGDAFVENATRATDKTYSGDKTLNAFNLYGTVTGTSGTINIYNGCNVTGNVGYESDGETPEVWNCPVNQYWIADADYVFAAVVDGTVATDDNGMPETITCNTAITNNVQSDLLYATATAKGKSSGNGKVNFSFSHLLSKAMFTVTSNTEGGYYYSVKNIQVNNYVNGTYYAQDVTEDDKTIAAGTWVGTGDKTNTAFGNIENVTATATNGLTCEYQRLLIPTTADFDVTFTVELWNDNGTADDVLLSTQAYKSTVSTDLVGGFAYNFKLDLTVGELIQFSVTSNPTWENGNTNDSNDEGTEKDYVPLTPVAVNN